MNSPLPTAVVGIQQAIDATLITWLEALDVLRPQVHFPEGAIEEWRAGDRNVAAVLVERAGRLARLADHADEGVTTVIRRAEAAG